MTSNEQIDDENNAVDFEVVMNQKGFVKDTLPHADLASKHARKSRQEEHDQAVDSRNGPFDRGYKPYNHIRRAPTVVLTKDGVWVEMRCPICKGNAKENLSYCTGIWGLKLHLKKAHGSEGAQVASIHKDAFIQKCKHAIVSNNMAMAFESWPSKIEEDDGDPVEVVPWHIGQASVQQGGQTATPISNASMASASPSGNMSEAFPNHSSDIRQSSMPYLKRKIDGLFTSTQDEARMERRTSTPDSATMANNLVRRISRVE